MRLLSSARGQASVESVLILGLLFLFVLATIEASQWWLIRQHCRVALSEGLRQGSVQHALIKPIQQGFERGLAPRFSPPPARSSETLSGLKAHGQRFQQRHGLAFYRLLPIYPAPEHFVEFARTDVQQQRRIRADFYQEQQQRLPTPQARRLEQALSLTMQVDYLHAPWSGLMRWLMSQIAQAAPDPDSWIQQARRQGLIVVRLQLSLPMQSDPIAEPRQPYYFFGS